MNSIPWNNKQKSFSALSELMEMYWRTLQSRLVQYHYLGYPCLLVITVGVWPLLFHKEWETATLFLLMITVQRDSFQALGKTFLGTEDEHLKGAEKRFINCNKFSKVKSPQRGIEPGSPALRQRFFTTIWVPREVLQAYVRRRKSV